MKELFLHRLAAQAEEAETQGLTKLATHLTEQINTLSLIDDNKNLSKIEIESSLWNLLVKKASAMDGKFHAEKAQNIIEFLANEIDISLNKLIK